MDECMVANEAFGGAFSCKAKSYSDEETLNNQIFLSLWNNYKWLIFLISIYSNLNK